MRRSKKYEQTIFSENKKIKDVKIVSSKLDTLKLSSIINTPKLVYKFHQETCVQCVEDELSILKEISNIIGNENIIII